MKFHEAYLSRAQVAENYPISIRRLCELHSFGVLSAVILNGKAFYRTEAVDQYFLRLAEQAEQKSSRLKLGSKRRAGRPTKAMEVAGKRRHQEAQRGA